MSQHKNKKTKLHHTREDIKTMKTTLHHIINENSFTTHNK